MKPDLVYVLAEGGNGGELADEVEVGGSQGMNGTAVKRRQSLVGGQSQVLEGGRGKEGGSVAIAAFPYCSKGSWHVLLKHKAYSIMKSGSGNVFICALPLKKTDVIVLHSAPFGSPAPGNRTIPKGPVKAECDDCNVDVGNKLYFFVFVIIFLF